MLNDWWFTGLWNTTASPIEIIWLVLSVLGLIFTSINFYRAMRTLHYLDMVNRNGLLRIAAHTLALEEGLRVIALSCATLIGVTAVFFNPGEVGGKIISWLIVGIILILVVKSYVAMKARGKIIDYEDTKGG